MSAIEHNFFDLQNTCLAYLLAVTSASLAFTLALEGVVLVSSGGFETATANGFLAKALHLSVMTVAFFLIGWLFAFFTALIPFVIGIALATRLAITHWSFFVFGAATTAIVTIPFFISIQILGINVQELEPTFYARFLRALPSFVFSGAVAGVVCYKVLRKRLSMAKI